MAEMAAGWRGIIPLKTVAAAALAFPVAICNDGFLTQTIGDVKMQPDGATLQAI